eukprot:167518-Pleurochrysis_carterae.AAC.1
MFASILVLHSEQKCPRGFHRGRSPAAPSRAMRTEAEKHTPMGCPKRARSSAPSEASVHTTPHQRACAA